MALSCPPGVTVIASKANVDVKCNSMFDTTKNSAVSVTLQNTASGDKVVVSKYYVYTSDNPNFAKLVSAQITVQAAPATSAATTTAVSSAQSSLNLGSAFVSIDKVLKLFGVER